MGLMNSTIMIREKSAKQFQVSFKKIMVLLSRNFTYPLTVQKQ